MKFIIFVNVKLKFIIFEGKWPLVEIDQWPEQTYYTWIFIKLTHFFIKSLGELQELYVWLTALVLLFSSCHCFFLGFTDSLFSSLVVVVVVVEAGTGTGRVGKGGNTKNRVGEGEGGELCSFHRKRWGRWAWHHILWHLWPELPSFFLKTLIGLQGCSKGGLSLVLELQENQKGS